MGAKSVTWAFEQATGSHTLKVVLLAIADSYNEKTGQCNPSVKDIMRKTELQERSVRKAINDLAEAKLLTIENRFLEKRGQVSHSYVLNFSGSSKASKDEPPAPNAPPPPALNAPHPLHQMQGGMDDAEPISPEKTIKNIQKQAENGGFAGVRQEFIPAPDAPTPPAPDAGGPPALNAPPPCTTCTPLEQELEQESNTALLVNRKLSLVGECEREGKTASPTLDDRFKQFWAAYPRKVAKEAARKAWARLQPSEQLCVVIMDALQLATTSEQWQRDEGRFIPHPATWLNGKRWEDEHATSDDRMNQPALTGYSAGLQTKENPIATGFGNVSRIPGSTSKTSSKFISKQAMVETNTISNLCDWLDLNIEVINHDQV